MKIAIPYQNGQVFPHFGHAPQFKFYTIESGIVSVRFCKIQQFPAFI